MDDLTLLAKSKNQIDSLLQTAYIQWEHWYVIWNKEVWSITTDGIRLLDGQDLKDFYGTGYTYLGILEIDKIKEKEMKEKFSKSYLRRLRLILRSKLNGRNKIMTVYT